MSADVNVVGSVLANAAEVVARTESPRPAKETSGRTSVQAPVAKAEAPEGELVEKVTSQLNEVLDTFNRGVNFQVDDSTEEMYVQIVDRNSGEVLKSIPSKELLAVMARIHEVVGMMVDIRG